MSEQRFCVECETQLASSSHKRQKYCLKCSLERANHHHGLTDEEQKIVLSLAGKKSKSEIGRQINRSQTAVWRFSCLHPNIDWEAWKTKIEPDKRQKVRSIHMPDQIWEQAKINAALANKSISGYFRWMVERDKLITS